MGYDYGYSEEEIVEGFREGKAFFFQEYFYTYCRVAYNIYKRRYDLDGKEGLDFMSLAHQYALYLMEHNWHPLEERTPNVGLRTWMVNGFRYIVLDALKWYRREYRSISLDEYLQQTDTSGDLRLEFNRVVEEMCQTHLKGDDATLVHQLLVEGYKAKDVAQHMGISPSAVSQRYKTLRERVLVPYMRTHFDMELDMPEVVDANELREMMTSADMATAEDMNFDRGIMMKACIELMDPDSAEEREDYEMEEQDYDTTMEKKRTTPERITELAPGEVFVFGSNLRGMHGGGAARLAYQRFGAKMGQGVGLQGQSYGIPTMQGGVETIRPYVDEFVAFAKEHPELTFLVTRIGCGIAGFRDSEIAPLFQQAHGVANIVLPEGW